jgi:hypothetical protein
MAFATIGALAEARVVSGMPTYLVLARGKKIYVEGDYELPPQYAGFFTVKYIKTTRATALTATERCLVVAGEIWDVVRSRDYDTHDFADEVLFVRPWPKDKGQLRWGRSIPLSEHARRGEKLLSERELVPRIAPDQLPLLKDEVVAIVDDERYIIKVKVKKQ